MPNYQQVRYLRAAMDSVLAQRYPGLEFLVVDGGSTDGSVEVIRARAHHLAWWCSGPDAGQTAAINAGLRRATGDVVGWLNSDDLLLPGALEKIARGFQHPSVQAICGWTITIDEAGRKIGRRVYPQPTREVLLRRSLMPQPAVYWRRSLLAEVGYLEESFHIRMDMDYYMRLGQHGVVPWLIRDFLAAFRVRPDQKSQSMMERGRAEELQLLQRVHGLQADRKRLRKGVPLGWRLRYRLMKQLASWGLAYRGPSPPGGRPARAGS